MSEAEPFIFPVVGINFSQSVHYCKWHPSWSPGPWNLESFFFFFSPPLLGFHSWTEIKWGWLFLHDILSPEASTSSLNHVLLAEASQPVPLTPASASQDISPPTRVVILFWTWSWHCPSRKPNLKFLLLTSDSQSTLFCLSLSCSFLNCFLSPPLIALISCYFSSPFLMGLEDRCFSVEPRKKVWFCYQPSASCLCVKLRSYLLFTQLFWFTGMGSADSPRLPCL